MIEPVLFDAGGIDKAVLLRELVNLVWHGQEERHLLPLRDARLEIALRERDEAGPEGKGPLYFEYMDGIRLGANLSGEQVDLSRYRNANFPEFPGEELIRLPESSVANFIIDIWSGTHRLNDLGRQTGLSP